MEQVRVIKPLTNTSEGIQLGNTYVLQKSGANRMSEASSNASSARSSKQSSEKSRNENSKDDNSVNSKGSGVKSLHNSSSISDNTSIDEELSCEIAVEHSSDEEKEDPLTNIIKEFGNISSLNFKTQSSLNNNNVLTDNGHDLKVTSKFDTRKKDRENANRKISVNHKEEKLYTSLSPINVPRSNNEKVHTKSNESHHKHSLNLGKRSYLDMKLTLTKKESINGVPVVQSSTVSRQRTASLPRRSAYKCPQDKEVGKYPYSLKLLGVQVPVEASTGDRQSRAFRSVSSQSWVDTPAKIQTRVKRRSVSLDDVKRVIPMLKDPAHLKSMFLNEHQRAVLNQAIYEEWYEIRSKELKMKKLKEKQEKENIEKNKLSSDQERKRISENVFNNWKKEKAKKSKEKKVVKKDEIVVIGESETKYSDSSAFESWKERKFLKSPEKLKEKYEKEREQKMKKIADVEEHRRKRKDADKAFEAWLRMKKEKLKKQWIELQEHKLKLQEKEFTRRHDAEAAFNFWKKKKEEEKYTKSTSDENTENRVAPLPPNVQEKKQLERRVSPGHPARGVSPGHPTSYEEWLDYVEDREDRYLLQMGKTALVSSLRPPWNPGGGESTE